MAINIYKYIFFAIKFQLSILPFSARICVFIIVHNSTSPIICILFCAMNIRNSKYFYTSKVSAISSIRNVLE